MTTMGTGFPAKPSSPLTKPKDYDRMQSMNSIITYTDANDNTVQAYEPRSYDSAVDALNDLADVFDGATGFRTVRLIDSANQIVVHVRDNKTISFQIEKA